MKLLTKETGYQEAFFQSKNNQQVEQPASQCCQRKDCQQFHVSIRSELSKRRGRQKPMSLCGPSSYKYKYKYKKRNSS